MEGLCKIQPQLFVYTWQNHLHIVSTTTFKIKRVNYKKAENWIDLLINMKKEVN